MGKKDKDKDAEANVSETIVEAVESALAPASPGDSTPDVTEGQYVPEWFVEQQLRSKK
jgi:hypothetical protein